MNAHKIILDGKEAVAAPAQRDRPRPQNESFKCNCGGETVIESSTSVLHDCKAQPGCKVFDNPRGFVRRVRVQINPELTVGVEKYNWFVDWQSTPPVSTAATNFSKP